MPPLARNKFYFNCLLLVLFACLVVVSILQQPLERPSNSLGSNNSYTSTWSEGNNGSVESLFGGYAIRNADRCNSARDPVITLVLVHSAVTHSAFRTVLRAYVPPDFRLLFLVGQVRDRGLQASIRQEASEFGDMTVGNFYDSYRNLTLKHLMGLSWAARHCSQAQLVLKVDDDIFVDYALLRRFMDEKFPKSDSDPLVTRTGYKVIGGFVQRHMRVVRDSTSKWYVTRGEQRVDFYPDFISGWAYLTTVDTIGALLDQVRGQLFWIDDVYVTGYLRASAKDIALETLNAQFNTDVGRLAEWLSTGLQGLQPPLKWAFLFSNANGEVELMRQAFEMSRTCEALGSACLCCFLGGPALGKGANRDGRVRPSAAYSSGRGSALRVPL